MRLMRWRANRQKVYLFVLFAVMFIMNKHFANQYESEAKLDEPQVEYKCETVNEPPRTQEMECVPDNGGTMKCWKDDEDVFVPFGYIKKRFDMTGKLSKDGKRFEILTSYSKTRMPEGNYNSSGTFGHFASYNVESRDRVKCISAITDVPMSIQWNITPYYYPIQISQYGLQHYSRLIQANYNYTSITKGEKSVEWKGAASMDETTERLFYNDEIDGTIVNITASYELANSGAYVYLSNQAELNIVEFEWKPFDRNSSFTILCRATLSSGEKLVLLNYVQEEDDRKCVWKISEDDRDQVSYAYSTSPAIGEWNKVNRDIVVDVSRAFSSELHRRKDDNVVLKPGDIRIVSIGFRGRLAVKTKITQANHNNEHAFRAAADWLLSHQDEMGGWQVPVERSIADRKLVLLPGWHSAMAQGHAISLLTRAFKKYGDKRYLLSAVNALKIFQVNASDGGIVNYFKGNIRWFEEYPTTPGTFVLNGFIYSLIGLFDLSMVKLNNIGKDENDIQLGIEKARQLYESGVESLRQLLPLYDTGSGSFYDLRHVGLYTAPNLARWDYHSVHIYLLKWLANLEKNNKVGELFEKTAQRWLGYANGKRAKHN